MVLWWVFLFPTALPPDPALSLQATVDVAPPLPPIAPPPQPPRCESFDDRGGCKWEGTRRLIYVAPHNAADTFMHGILRTMHEQIGIPYAWGGKHANWATEATARGFTCSNGKPPIANAAMDGSDQRQCRCFLEYMHARKLTTNGMWICQNTNGPDFNRMLREVMPHADWFTTLRDPWHHLLVRDCSRIRDALNTSPLSARVLDPRSHRRPTKCSSSRSCAPTSPR